MNVRSLDVIGYRDQQVPTTFITHPDPTNHLGIILPGYRYSADMPPLYYAGQVLAEQGADVLRVDYAYYRTSFMAQPQNEQDQWISSDVLAACNAALSQHPYEKITLVGKSLGTIAMVHLLADNRFQKAICIWFTPILTLESLRSRIEQVRPRSLFIIGTADQFYKPDILESLKNSTSGETCIIEGANHGLEIPADVPASLVMLNTIVQALRQFLSEASPNVRQSSP
jgi:predicted alpha/beta-hydrolase family hydrolase